MQESIFFNVHSIQTVIQEFTGRYCMLDFKSMGIHTFLLKQILHTKILSYERAKSLKT